MRKRSARAVVTVRDLVVALGAASSAGAGHLVTSKDIKDGTIKRADLSAGVNTALD